LKKEQEKKKRRESFKKDKRGKERKCARAQLAPSALVWRRETKHIGNKHTKKNDERRTLFFLVS
jgi:hypothetical protein